MTCFGEEHGKGIGGGGVEAKDWDVEVSVNAKRSVAEHVDGKGFGVGCLGKGLEGFADVGDVTSRDLESDIGRIEDRFGRKGGEVVEVEGSVGGGN